MAKLPNSKETVKDPGLGAVGPANNTCVVIGSTGSANKNTVYYYTDPQKLIDEHIAGPAVDEALHVLKVAGGPVGLISTNDSVTGSAGSITSPVGAETISISGDSLYDVEGFVNITAAGAAGAAKFQYSLDSGRSFSPELTIPLSGTFVLPNGQTLTFGSTNPFEAGDSYSIQGVTTSAISSADLSAAMSALDADPRAWRFVLVSTSAASGDSAAHSVLTVALQSELAAMAVAGKYRAGIINADKTNSGDYIADYAGVEAIRVAINCGTAVVLGVNPIIGRSFPEIGGSAIHAASAASGLISTDPKRVLNNAAARVISIGLDGRVDGGQGLDDIMLSSLRTYEGRPGFYITQTRLKSPPGSDFTVWPRRIVMDVACEVTHQKQETFIGRGVRVVDGGFIDNRDALRFEKEVQDVLDARLTSPRNSEGTDGHVSDVLYTIARDDNLLANPTIRSKVAILPLQYADYIETELGFVASIGDN
jgi:hypothetical protein